MAQRIPRDESLSRVHGVGALFSAAYGNVGSSIYYALGVTAAFALGLERDLLSDYQVVVVGVDDESRLYPPRAIRVARRPQPGAKWLPGRRRVQAGWMGEPSAKPPAIPGPGETPRIPPRMDSESQP
jgi:hypothetical protein